MRNVIAFLPFLLFNRKRICLSFGRNDYNDATKSKIYYVQFNSCRTLLSDFVMFYFKVQFTRP